MKVLYLRLDGYANILAGMKKRSVEINFSKAKNRIILILGENGSGKTSILSHIQPFAFPVGDSRSGKQTLIKDTPAYKEIHYDLDGLVYVIKHYVNEKGTIKSYISENGNELNPNGNVTSFKELVEAILFVTEDTIKLMRLGTNSSTFLKLNSTERKTFTTQLLSDIEIYSKLYKKINEDFRILRSLIRNVSGKIDSLNIGDVNVAKERLKEIDVFIETQRENRDNLVAEIGATNSKVERYKTLNVHELRSEMSELVSEINKIHTKISRVNGKSLPEVRKELIISKDALQEKLLRINTLEASVSSLRDRMNDTRNSIDSLTSKLQMVQSSSEIGSLSQLLIKIDKEIKDLEEKFSDFKTEASLEDFKRLLEIFKDIEHKVSISHGFDHTAIKKVIKLYLETDRPDRELQDEFKGLNARAERLKAQISAQKFKGTTDDHNYMIFKDSNCKCNCPFESFYDEVTSSGESKTKDLESDLREVRRKIDLIDDKFAISSNLDLIKMVVEANKSLISRLPAGILNFNTIIEKMYNSEPVYDEDYLTRYISFMEEYENIGTLKEKRRDIKEEISKIRGNSETIMFLNEELLKHTTSFEGDKATITKMEDEISLWEPDIETLTYEVAHLEELQSALENVVNLKDRLVTCENRVEEIKSIIHLLADNANIINKIQSDIRSVEANIVHLTNNKNELVKRLDAHDSLNEELKLLEEKFEKVNILRETLSSTKGIPLIYIKLYMMDINTNINRLLKRVYGDGLEVKEFIIDERGFQIPYISNGVEVEDVSMASQGEDTFMSLAFSFAFGGSYNVMTLDELDGPLDSSRRDTFIDIFDEQMDEVGAEQAILISHNNVFDSYPVDAILTSDTNIDSYKNMNIIFKA